jgi:hypothetical protein
VLQALKKIKEKEKKDEFLFQVSKVSWIEKLRTLKEAYQRFPRSLQFKVQKINKIQKRESKGH